ncbi:MAG: D-2-hydroxyacid dehydrogenase [Bulleidia sp.]
MKAVCLTPIPENRRNLFEKENLEVIFTDRSHITKEMLEGAEIIFGNVKPEWISEIPSVRWVQLDSAGADSYRILRDDIILTNASGAYGPAISEHMIGCVFAVLKNLYAYYDRQKTHAWDNLGSVPVMSNLKVLSVGMGDIGSAFAQKMHMLGCTVYGVRRGVHEAPDYVEAMYTMRNMDEILPECDIVALSLPQTPETIGLFDYPRLARMKKGAVILNVGRGSAIVSTDLIRIMNEGHLKAACLDVCEHEPLPKNNPLWNTEHVYITPHISGRFNAEVTYDRVLDIFETNLDLYLQGKPLRHVVDKSIGY